jgi:hypothetical protein
VNALEDGTGLVPCVRHPGRETALRCGKCGTPICVRCVVQTPVGGRCPTCANLRRLPQFDVGWSLTGRAALGGLAASAVGWYVLSFLPYLRYFLSILVGVAVGEIMSRLARRRTSLALEVAAVVVVAVGLIAIEMFRTGDGARLFQDMANQPGMGMTILLPGVIASIVAVVKLR